MAHELDAALGGVDLLTASFRWPFYGTTVSSTHHVRLPRRFKPALHARQFGIHSAVSRFV
jgi:hypothetical protein